MYGCKHVVRYYSRSRLAWNQCQWQAGLRKCRETQLTAELTIAPIVKQCAGSRHDYDPCCLMILWVCLCNSSTPRGASKLARSWLASRRQHAGDLHPAGTCSHSADARNAKFIRFCSLWYPQHSERTRIACVRIWPQCWHCLSKAVLACQ
jgi:hypothetical protein